MKAVLPTLSSSHSPSIGKGSVGETNVGDNVGNAQEELRGPKGGYLIYVIVVRQYGRWVHIEDTAAI